MNCRSCVSGIIQEKDKILSLKEFVVMKSVQRDLHSTWDLINELARIMEREFERQETKALPLSIIICNADGTPHKNKPMYASNVV